MKALINRNQPFLIPYILFLLGGGILLASWEKAELHLFFNQYHHPSADIFFRYITYMGDGVAVVIVTVLALFVRYRFAIIIGLANIISSSTTQVLKHTVFEDHDRPLKFFKGLHDIYLVKGVNNYSSFSFPSGHSTAAFTLYFCLALIIPDKRVKMLLFFLSLAASFSRVYLSQHFFSDVYAGSLIGVTVSLAVYYTVENSRRFNNRVWLDWSLLSRTSKPARQ